MKEQPDPAPPRETLEVIEEQLRVDRRLRETGALRVRVETEQVDTEVTLERTDEEVVVERVAVDRVVTQRREPWQDGEVTVVPIYAEVTVVQLMLVEELRLHRRASRSSATARVPLARQRAVVERRQPDGSWTEVDPPGRTTGDAADAKSPESSHPLGASR